MYKVTTIITDSGAVTARLYTPEDVEGVFDGYDCYIDKFRTKKEALAFIEECENG